MNKLFNFIVKIRFESSKFEFSKEQFGDIKDHRCWLKDSLILNACELLSLVEMTKSNKAILLYRATRDGFGAKDYHSRCDGKTNTITIIKNDLNYVFGGYASAAWDTSNGSKYTNDPKAFLFSLRRDGKSYNDKFEIKNPLCALYGNADCGLSFGGGHDILVCDQSNITTGSYTYFGHSYCVPVGYSYGGNAQSFLAGNYNQWTTTEIEVYQIS